MDFEFAVPIRLSELQTKQGVSDYSVNEVFSTRVLPNKLAGEGVRFIMST